MERDNWADKFSPDGSALVPITGAPDVAAAIEAGRGPTESESRAILGTDPAPSVPAKWDGKTRPDWNAPARAENGQFVTKSEGELRQQWTDEQGLAHVYQTVMGKESAMYSVAPSLEAKVLEHLDRAFLTKAVDHLRLGVSYGPDGFWRSVAQFEDSLSPSERDAWAKFCRSLNEDEQAALIYGMSK